MGVHVWNLGVCGCMRAPCHVLLSCHGARGQSRSELLALLVSAVGRAGHPAGSDWPPPGQQQIPNPCGQAALVWQRLQPPQPPQIVHQLRVRGKWSAVVY